MTHSGSFEFSGQCLCEAVKFTGRIGDPELLACHCGQCRRWSGHVWAAITTTELTVASTTSLRWFPSSDTAERGFCATCGSSLFWRRQGADAMDVAAGALNLPTGLRLGGHIHTASKGDYYDIDDGLPQDPRE